MKIVKETNDIMVLKDRGIIAAVFGVLLILLSLSMLLKPNIFTGDIPLFVSLIILAFGMILIVLPKRVTITANRQVRTLTVLKWNLFGKGVEEYDISTLQYVLFSTTVDLTSSDNRHAHHLDLILQDNGIIPLVRGSATIRIGWKTILPLKKTGKRIAMFLAVPFRENKPKAVGISPYPENTPLRNMAKQ